MWTTRTACGILLTIEQKEAVAVARTSLTEFAPEVFTDSGVEGKFTMMPIVDYLIIKLVNYSALTVE